MKSSSWNVWVQLLLLAMNVVAMSVSLHFNQTAGQRLREATAVRGEAVRAYTDATKVYSDATKTYLRRCGGMTAELPASPITKEATARVPARIANRRSARRSRS